MRSRVRADRRRKSRAASSPRDLGGGGVHVGEDVEPSRLLGEARDVGERLLPLLAAGGVRPPGRVEGAGRVAHVHLEQRADLPLEVRPLGRILLGGEPVLADREPGLGIPGGDQDLVEEREHLPPPRSGFPRHLEQRLANAWMFGVAGGHLGEEAEGAGGIAQPEPSQLGDLEREIGVEERRREPLLERPGQVGGAIELGGELLQLGRGGHVVRLPRQPVARDQEPFHRVDGGRRHRELQAGGKLGMGSQLGEDRHEPLPVLRGLEGARHAGEQACRLLPGHDRDRAPVGRDRRHRIAQPLEQEVAQLGGERRSLGRRRLEPLALVEQVARLLPSLSGQRETRQRRQHLPVGGIDLEQPAQLGRRLLVRPQLLLRELRRPHAQGALLGGLAGERVGGPGQEGVELGEGPGPGGEVLHPAPGLGVGRGLAQGGRRGVERAARVSEPILPDGRHVEPHARAVGGRGRLVARDHLEHLHVAAGVAGGGVDGHERPGDAHRLDAVPEEPLERPDGVGGQRRGEPSRLHEREPGRRRVHRTGERLEEQGRPLGLELGPVGRPLGGEARQHLAELGDGGFGAVGPQRGGEATKGLGVGAVRGEELAPGGLGPPDVADLQIQSRDLRREFAPLGSGRRRQPAGELLDELGLAPRAGERRLVGGRRPAIPGVEVGEHPPDPRRLLGMPEVVLLDLGHASKERLAGPEVGAGRRRPGPEGQGERAEVAGAGRQRLELPPRRHARRLGDEGPGEDAARLGRVPDGILGHLGGAKEERGPRARIPLLRRDRLQGVDELRPGPGRLEDREERPCGRGEPGRLAQRRLQHAPGPGRLPGRDRHRRAPEPERGVLGALGARVEVALQDREGLRLAPSVHVGLEEVERGLVVGRIEIQGAGERVDGPVGIAEPDEQELRQAEVGGHRRREVAGAARQPRELLAQGGPVAPAPRASAPAGRARAGGRGRRATPGRRTPGPSRRRRGRRRRAAPRGAARSAPPPAGPAPPRPAPPGRAAWSRQVRGADRSRSSVSAAPGAVRSRSIASTVASRASPCSSGSSTSSAPRCA